MCYIDTHAHLNLKAFADDHTSVIDKCLENSVTVINVGTKLATSERAVSIANENKNMYATIGLHPIQTVAGRHDEEEVGEGGEAFFSKGEEFTADDYRSLALSSDKVVGIGECGFDYYHMEKNSYLAQETAFIAQIKLANELSLPLMIHTRNPKPGLESPTGRSVYFDVFEILKKYAKVHGNVHFFAGTYADAERFFSLGFTISFTGVITFAKDYEEVVKETPLDLMHAETDSPYVAPVPYRGKRCEPWMVTKVYERIAHIKNIPLEKVRDQLSENALRHYGIQIDI